MTKEVLTFVVFIIHNLSEELNISPEKVYRILSDSKIIDTYLIPSYDVLHTLGREYLIEDISSLVKERGWSWQ